MGANQAGLDKFLFGRAAAMIAEDVAAIGWVGAAALFLVILFWKEFKLLCFDPDFAATLGFPVRFLDVLLTTLIVVGVVIGLQMVGVVLMAALIVAPPAAARQWTDRLGLMILLSALFGAFSGVSGALISSWARGLSTGPVIVLCASAIALISLMFAPNRGLLWDWLRRRRNHRRLARLRLLEVVYNQPRPRQPVALAELQAALPFYRDISRMLAGLQREGLVIPTADGRWALTRDGVAMVEHQNVSRPETIEPRRQEVMI
jgi:manganese/zinc/iron transport system permease protein